MRLLLIRHAETDTNAALRYGGQAAVPLNERGRRQAAQTAQRLLREQVTLLYTSEIVRAAETATLLGETLRLPPQVQPDLREIDLGQWEALTPESMYRRFPDSMAEYARDPNRPVRTGGESYAQLRQRVGQALALFAAAGDATVAAVTHGGVIRAALGEVIGLELRAFPRLLLDPAGISELHFGTSGWRLQRLNDTAHLL